MRKPDFAAAVGDPSFWGSKIRLLTLAAGLCFRAGLKTVASAILADVELGFQPGGKNLEATNDPVKCERFRNVGAFFRRQDAALRQAGRPAATFQTGS